MDPIFFYGSLIKLPSALATIVNVAGDTPAGLKTLDSILKELPILFSLLEEMKEASSRQQYQSQLQQRSHPGPARSSWTMSSIVSLEGGCGAVKGFQPFGIGFRTTA
jgi:hypothetical protein